MRPDAEQIIFKTKNPDPNTHQPPGMEDCTFKVSVFWSGENLHYVTEIDLPSGISNNTWLWCLNPKFLRDMADKMEAKAEELRLNHNQNRKALHLPEV